MSKQIIPAIIAKNQKELDERFKRVEGFGGWIHLDVMDGKFVKNRSLMFDFKVSKKYKYEAHLMMNGYKAMHWLKKNGKKVDLIIIHYEADNFKSLLGHLVKQKYKIFIALNPKTSIKVIGDFESKINGILLMSVNPGKYGSKFLSSVIKKIREVRRKYPKLKIEVDGGLNDKTIGKISRLEVNRFVFGSYFQNSEDICNTYIGLKKLIK